MPEIAFVKGCGGVEQREQTLAAPATGVVLGRGLFVLELDVEPVGKPLDRTHEVQLLGLLDEPDRVPADAAAEAVVGALDGTDGEARCALVVKGTAPHVAGAGLAQLRAGGDDVDDRRSGLDALDGRVLETRSTLTEPAPVPCRDGGRRRRRRQAHRWTPVRREHVFCT